MVRWSFEPRDHGRPVFRGPWRLVQGVWLRATESGLRVGPVLNETIRASAAPDLYAGYYVIPWGTPV